MIVFNYGDYYDDTVSEGDSYLTETLNQLEIRKEGYGVLMEALSNALEDIYESMESEASEYRDAQMNQPYYGLELDATGKPASEAVARRSELVEAYIDEEIRPDYIEQAERVTEDYAEQLAQVQLNILDIIEALNEKELTYNSFQDELTVAITGYDETSMEFAGYANIAIGSQTVRFDISFSYADWTGENVNTSPETMEEYYEYQQYAANAAQWSESLMENSALFMLEVDFYVEAYTDSQRYAVFVDSYDVTRMDTGDRVVHNKDVGMRYLSSGRTAYFNFSSVPLTAGARECILYFDYYGILAEEQEKEDIPELWNIYAYEPDTSANFNNADEDDRRAQAGSMTSTMSSSSPLTTTSGAEGWMAVCVAVCLQHLEEAFRTCFTSVPMRKPMVSLSVWGLMQVSSLMVMTGNSLMSSSMPELDLAAI